jgi:succinate dehydrogenase / fumarate reductase, membrane anchor subunit
MDRTMRTPLGRVRSKGSAKSGTEHFIGERVSSVALAVLSIWFLVLALSGLGGGFDAARALLTHPANAVAMILFVIASFYHMQLGLTVIVEDYIARPLTRSALLVLNAFICWAFAALGVFAILKISLGV